MRGAEHLDHGSGRTRRGRPPGGSRPAAGDDPGDDPVVVSRLRAAAWTMAGIAAVLFSLSRHTAGTLDPDVLALVGASVAATLLFATAWLDVLVWRLTGDPRSVFLAAAALSLAAVPILMGVVVPALTHAALLDHARHSVAIAGIPALVVLTLAARAPAAPAVRSARFVVVAALVVTAGLAVALAAPGARTLAFHDDVSLPLAGPTTSLALAAAFGVVAAVHAGLTRRRTGHLLTWSGIAVTGVGVAYAIEAAGGGTVHVAAWLMTCAAIAVGLYGTSLDLERERVAEQRAARDAVAVASVATARARAVHEVQQEHRHEARAALLGIEAAAECLSRYRRGLSPDEQAELSRGLVAEIRRLRFLVEDTVRRTTTYDLRDAVMPVVCCSRANGLAVSADVPAGLEVEGVPESTAQVVLSLLTNARCHAPGSPVELRAEPGEREVALYVEDRGPGLPPALDEPLFQRSARGPGSRGAGLGLFVARGLMARQRGSIDARPRPGGGCSFVVRLPRPGIAT